MGEPILDAHVHLWDPAHLDYGWLSGSLDHRFDASRLREVAGDAQHIVVEADCAPSQRLDEVDWIAGMGAEASIVGIVACAPLEHGDRVRSHLAALRSRPLVVGVRRLLQGAPAGFATTPDFITGARAVSEAGLAFDACVHEHGLGDIIDLADAVPDLRIVLDHLGKPPVGTRSNPREPSDLWRARLRELAARPNVWAKLSGLPAEAGEPGSWDAATVRPFLDEALTAFGADRLLFGSDWPVSQPAVRWRDVVATWAREQGEDVHAAVMAGTARHVYRVGRSRSDDIPPSTSMNVPVVDPDEGLTR